MLHLNGCNLVNLKRPFLRIPSGVLSWLAETQDQTIVRGLKLCGGDRVVFGDRVFSDENEATLELRFVRYQLIFDGETHIMHPSEKWRETNPATGRVGLNIQALDELTVLLLDPVLIYFSDAAEDHNIDLYIVNCGLIFESPD